MKKGQALNIFAVAAVVLTMVGGWVFRAPLGQTLGRAIVEQAQQSAQSGSVFPRAVTGAAGSADLHQEVAGAPAPETVYRWVDAEGVTHYDQTGGAGREAVTLDPRQVQRLEDLTPAPADSQP